MVDARRALHEHDRDVGRLGVGKDGRTDLVADRADDQAVDRLGDQSLDDRDLLGLIAVGLVGDEVDAEGAAAPSAKSWISFQYGFEIRGTTKPIVGTLGLATGVPGGSVGTGASLAAGDAPGDSDCARTAPVPETAAVASKATMPMAETHLGPRI